MISNEQPPGIADTQTGVPVDLIRFGFKGGQIGFDEVEN
jgi:hypothetical protein